MKYDMPHVPEVKPGDTIYYCHNCHEYYYKDRMHGDLFYCQECHHWLHTPDWLAKWFAWPLWKHLTVFGVIAILCMIIAIIQLDRGKLF